ncbi:MAG: hypothetical protein IPP22_09445 [Nitrosomonas sp.]|nr:hypothetical protein [Nitrosomonas sp.]
MGRFSFPGSINCHRAARGTYRTGIDSKTGKRWTSAWRRTMAISAVPKERMGTVLIVLLVHTRSLKLLRYQSA